MHDPSSARFLCITKAHTHLQISHYLPRTHSLSLSLSLPMNIFTYSSLQLFKLYMLHMALGPLLDGISEFLIISPVWQIAENSDESDFENFRSALAVPVTLMVRRCQRICRRGCRRQHVEHVFPLPFTCGACPATAHRQSQSQN